MTIKSEGINVKAIIMAGGEGSRLRPLTCTRPKPMVKLLDKPAIEYTIELLKKHRITEIGITTRYLSEEIMDYLGDGSDFGVSITYFNEETPLGTAGSVKSALSFLDSTFVVISGDALTDIDISDAADFHKNNGADATLVLKKNDVPLEYGVVVTDKNGRIVRLIEKPDWGEVISDTVNTGIYILEPEIFADVPDAAPFDFSCDLFPMLLHEKKNLFGYVADGYWCDIGDTFAYMSCQYDMLCEKTDVLLTSKQISDGVFVGENVTIEPGTELCAPIYIGSNVHIGENARIGEYSIIESGAHIGNFANIKKSIIGTGAHIGAFSQLRACIIGSKAKLKSSVCVYEQSVIGDMCKIGEGSVIKPSIKLWPDKTVEAHTQVHTNLVWENVRRKSLFEAGRIQGEVGVDLSPEMASCIGAAFGTLSKNGRIAVSVCGGASADMLSKALISGLMSSGCEVYDFGTQLSAMTRFAVRFYTLDGGIHIHTQKRPDGHYAKISLMDKNGCDIAAKQQRRLESLYERNDFLRAEGSSVRKIVSIKNYKDFYIRDIMKRVSGEPLEKKILVNTQNSVASDIIVRICGEIGAQISISRDELMPLSSEAFNVFASRVRDEGFLFGAVLDDECENLILIDENGRTLGKNSVLSLDIVVALNSGSEHDIVMPVSAPRGLARLAAQKGKNVIYTKIETSDFMREVANSGNEQQFVMHFDGVGSLLRLLVYLTEKGQKLSELAGQADEYFITDNKVYCRSEQKGAVIKELINQYENYETDFTDGIKIFEENGWILVVPDSSAPAINVISEGQSTEAANELAGDIMDKINKIITNFQ